jgi:hypothetical protein
MYALQKFFGLALIKIVELAIQIFSKNSIVFSEDIFSSNALFKENYLPIKNEYLSYIEKYELDNMSDIFEEQKRIAPDDNWKNVMLLLYGEVIIKHQLHFPFTSQLIKNNPNITSAFFFSFRTREKNYKT